MRWCAFLHRERESNEEHGYDTLHIGIFIAAVS